MNPHCAGPADCFAHTGSVFRVTDGVCRQNPPVVRATGSSPAKNPPVITPALQARSAPCARTRRGRMRNDGIGTRRSPRAHAPGRGAKQPTCTEQGRRSASFPGRSPSTATAPRLPSPDTNRACNRWPKNRRQVQPPQSRKLRSCSERLGWRSLRSALASIWRMRSRVTSNCLPTSSSV